MRSSRVITLVIGVALLAACGNSTGPSNPAPTAAFTVSCSNLDCTFTDGSTDTGGGSIASRSWDFGDGQTSTQTNPQHSFASANTYAVKLTVTDNGGAIGTVTKQVQVPNTPPSVDFTSACTDLACTFTDQSTDADVGGSIASYSWDFGDQTAVVTDKNPQHTYGAAGTYQVKLTATDNGGASGTVTKPVTVTAAQAGGPTAKFTVACTSLDCTVTNLSTATGAVVTWAWDFGDGSTSTVKNPPVHSYNVSSLTPFTIKLTVTSDGLTSTATQDINVAPPATLTCGTTPNCKLGLDVASKVKVTLVSSSCQAHGNAFIITAPAVDTLFTDGCFATVGTTFDLNNGAAYTAGTELDAEVVSGVSGITLKYPPTIRVTGDFANGWTLTFDDGAGGPGEPDFNDLVITVKATPSP